MEAKELRIGNIVLRQNFLYNEKHIFREIKVSHNDITACVIDGESFSPIQLTEDWHNKFGCCKDGFISFQYKVNDRKKIIFSGDYIYLRDIQDMSNQESVGDDICVLWNNDIKGRSIFVHEWQNLWFALAGTELPLLTQ